MLHFVFEGPLLQPGTAFRLAYGEIAAACFVPEMQAWNVWARMSGAYLCSRQSAELRHGAVSRERPPHPEARSEANRASQAVAWVAI